MSNQSKRDAAFRKDFEYSYNEMRNVIRNIDFYTLKSLELIVRSDSGLKYLRAITPQNNNCCYLKMIIIALAVALFFLIIR